MNSAIFESKNALKLVGSKIVEITTDEDCEYFGLKVVKGEQIYIVWVDKDSEGNGCGHLDIQFVAKVGRNETT